MRAFFIHVQNLLEHPTNNFSLKLILIYSVTANAITATTENDYYGYRSLYGLKILSWLERSYLAYEATKEILSDDQCYQQFVCQLVSLPQEDRSWLLQQFEWIWEHSNKHQENCVKKNFTCHKYEKYLEINI